MRWATIDSMTELIIDHRGLTPRKLKSEFVDNGVPVASAQLVKDGLLDLTNARHVTPETYTRWMTEPLKTGDVLVTSEAPIGRVALLDTDTPLVLGQRLFGLRPKSGALIGRFLYYALQLDSVQKDLMARATGTTVSGISQPSLRKVQIPELPIQKQQAIADVLGALDGKIATNSQMVHTLTELAQSHIEYLLLESNLQRLGDVSDILMGSAPKGSSYNELGDGVLLYQGMRDFGERWPSPRIWTTAPTRIAEANDILVSVRAPVGSLNIASERCCIGRGLARIRTRAPAALYHLLRSQAHIFASFNSEGTVYGSINKDSLRALTLMVPDVGLEATELKLAPLEARVGAALREAHTLAQLRNTLLPALMDGRIRIKDAVRKAEEVL